MTKLIAGAVTAGLIWGAGAVEYTLIPYDKDKMKASGSSEYNTERGYTHAIDGSGLTDLGNGVWGHTDTYQNTMWMTTKVDLSSTAPKFFCVDLGETYNVGRIKIWNFNQNGQSTRGFKATEIYVSADENPAKATPADVRAWNQVWTGELSKATGNNDKGCAPIDITNGVLARHVAFVVTSSWGDGGYQGLSEVRFFSVPMPGAPVIASAGVSATAAGDALQAEVTLGADAQAAEVTAILTADPESDPTRVAFGEEAGPAVAVTQTLSGLSANTTYAVSFEAANSVSTEVTKPAETVYAYTGVPSLAWQADGQDRGLVPAEVTVSRANADPYPLEVNYTVTSSDGEEGVDWEPVSGVVTIPANAAETVISIQPMVNADKREDVHLSVSLAAGAYLTTGAASVALTIANASLPDDANVWVASSSSDGLASTAANWSRGVPRVDDPASLVIVIDGINSTKSMIWDATGENGLATTVTSWNQAEQFKGSVTFWTTYPSYAASSFKTFTVTGDMIVNGGTLTHPVSAVWDNIGNKDVTLDALRSSYTYRLSLAAGTFTLGANAKISAAGKGHSWLRKSTNVKFCAPSHGGRNETTSIGCYGNPKYPEDIGLASNIGSDSLGKCGVGGGAVKLGVAGACVIDGEISVDGTVSSGSLAAGAAGSVLIEAARVTGSGLVHADGIYSGNNSQPNGTGGRIAVLTTDPVVSGQPTLRAGGVGTGKYAAEGTVYLKDATMTHGVLVLNNPLYTSPNATATRGVFVTNEEGVEWTFDAIRMNGHANLYVPAGTTLTLPNGFASITAPDNTSLVSGLYSRDGTIDVGSGDQTIGGGRWYFCPTDGFTFPANVTVASGSAIGFSGYWEPPALSNSAAPTTAWKLRFTVTGDLTLAEGGLITANSAGLGQQSGSQYAGVAIGAHGGRRSAAGATMDSVFTPHVPGVYQSNSYNYVKAGGVIDLTVGGKLTVDGKILSDSPDTADSARGNAAGGAINVVASSISGSGLISASAKRDTQCGGRVAVKLTGQTSDFSAFTGSFAAYAGGSTSGSSAGSVYLEAGADGDKGGLIIIDNNNKDGLTTPICATGYDADAVADFKKGRLLVRNKGQAQVAVADDGGTFRMRSVEVGDNSKLDLFGKTFVVGSAKLGAVKLGPGTYRASDAAVSGFLVDSAGTDGALVVAGNGLVMVVR